MPTTSYFYVGLDLGQAQDYTALCVVEQIKTPPRKSITGRVVPGTGEPTCYHLRHLERFELGTSYPDQVRRVKALSGKLGERCRVVVDQTGVGRPVVDLLKEAGVYPMTAVTITGGNSVKKRFSRASVPKRDLASTLQTLLQSGRLKFAEGLPGGDVLAKELQNFKVKINVNTAHASFEHWRERDHDDMVLALALACWEAEHGRSGEWADLEPIGPLNL